MFRCWCWGPLWPMPKSRSVHRIVINAPITPAVSDFIASSIESAGDAGAAALIIELDTPGGLLNSTKTIVKAVMAAELPILMYVSPGGGGAISAGVFITMSGHIAAMAPGTNIGAAHPVGGQGQDIEGDMREKVENFTVSFVETIAKRRGRNVEWAELAVRESVAVTETEAVELNVVDFVAAGPGRVAGEGRRPDRRCCRRGRRPGFLRCAYRQRAGARRRCRKDLSPDGSFAHHRSQHRLSADDGRDARSLHGVFQPWGDLPRCGRSDLPAVGLTGRPGVADQLYGRVAVVAWDGLHHRRDVLAELRPSLASAVWWR